MKKIKVDEAIKELVAMDKPFAAYGKGVLFPEVHDVRIDVVNENHPLAYSHVDDKEKYIHVDVAMAVLEETCLKKDVSLEDAILRLRGVMSHEAFHLLYTDFGPMVEICKNGAEGQAQMPKLAKKWQKCKDEASKKAVEEEARKALYDYVEANYLKELDNSLEDAWIENIGPSYKPQTYAGIVASRDSITRMEIAGADTSKSHESSEWIHSLIADIRHLAVIDYRQEVETPYLDADENLNDKVNELRQLCYYARFSCENSWDVYSVAKAILNTYLKDRITAKVDEFLNGFIKALEAGDTETAGQPQMDDMAAELSIASHKKEAGGQGASRPSEFNIDLDEKNQKALDDAKKETAAAHDAAEKAAQEAAQGSQDSADSKSGADGSDNADSSQSESGNSTDSSSDASQSGQSGNSAGASDSSSAESGSDGASQSESGNSAGNEDAVSDRHAGKPVKSVSDVKKDGKSEAIKAAAAVESDIKTLEKQADKAAEKSLEKEIFGSNGSGHSPNYEGTSKVPGSLSHMHDGVGLQFFSPDECAKYVGRYEGVRDSDIQKISRRSAQFANQLKRVLMYRANDTKLFGQKSGKINTPQLFRAKTDGRVFKQVTQGKKVSARICVLVDQSGSMHGQKAYDAALASMLLAQACSRIKVPCAVYGFNSPNYDCNLYKYIPFDGYLKYRDNLNLVERASGGNRDSLAYFHAAIDLAKHAKKDEKLVMIVISDGSPADDDYYGQPALNDLKGFINYFKVKKNISAIGVGIGDDTEHIPLIYDAYSIVPDVDELPEELLGILKKIMTE